MASKRKSEDDFDDSDKKQQKIDVSQIPGRYSRAYFAIRKGEREEMQDAHVLMDHWSQSHCPDIEKTAYYAVFDGHNGNRAAKFAAQNLHAFLGNKIAAESNGKAVDLTLKKALIDSYRQVDELFLGDATKQKPSWKDGTTATTILIMNGSLISANLGDSRAILCRFKPEENKEIALLLTKDHSPLLFEERMRIQKAGGSVKDGRILGILEVSRSIGDGQYKAYGVSCLPDIKKCSLTENDRYILMACDGLWKTFTNKEAIAHVAEALSNAKRNKELVASEDKSLEQIRWESVCASLASEAVRKGCGDNVTVVIILLDQYS